MLTVVETNNYLSGIVIDSRFSSLGLETRDDSGDRVVEAELFDLMESLFGVLECSVVLSLDELFWFTSNFDDDISSSFGSDEPTFLFSSASWVLMTALPILTFFSLLFHMSASFFSASSLLPALSGPSSLSRLYKNAGTTPPPIRLQNIRSRSLVLSSQADFSPS